MIGLDTNICTSHLFWASHKPMTAEFEAWFGCSVETLSCTETQGPRADSAEVGQDDRGCQQGALLLSQ